MNARAWNDLTTQQWAGLMERREVLQITTAHRVAQGRLRSVWRGKVELDYPPGEHDGFPLSVPRRDVLRVARRVDREWRRVRPSRAATSY